MQKIVIDDSLIDCDVLQWIREFSTPLFEVVKPLLEEAWKDGANKGFDLAYEVNRQNSLKQFKDKYISEVLKKID